jgi:hypothetical protein
MHSLEHYILKNTGPSNTDKNLWTMGLTFRPLWSRFKPPLPQQAIDIVCRALKNKTIATENQGFY